MQPVHLRDVVPADFPIFFQFMSDAGASRMAAFGTRDADAEALAARWKRALEPSVRQMAVVAGEEVVGFVSTYRLDGKTELTYWIGRAFWGRGLATEAVEQMLRLVQERPLYASAAGDNHGSLRVLEKCGFRRVGVGRAFATARGEDVDEVFFELVRQP